ncbi:unnamed protein product [Linum trigynum]|uniref:RING-type E3 ubiquitin transferase n=1 Tax=Linum trigynum TaxID=586398 RepID=A0AAV2D864_9ROSI
MSAAHYHCAAWLSDDDDDSSNNADDHEQHRFHDSRLPPAAAGPVFLIQLFARIIPQDLDPGQEESEIPTIHKHFRVPRDHLLRDPTSWSTIVARLLEMEIPAEAHPIAIARIHECAQEYWGTRSNRQVVTMTVQISSSSQEYMGRISSSGRPEATSESAVEELEKVWIGRDGETKSCVICLDEIRVGSEATRMPCFHLYHGGCIRSWLRKSRFCPLCRFQMPSSVEF